MYSLAALLLNWNREFHPIKHPFLRTVPSLNSQRINQNQSDLFRSNNFKINTFALLFSE